VEAHRALGGRERGAERPGGALADSEQRGDGVRAEVRVIQQVRQGAGGPLIADRGEFPDQELANGRGPGLAQRGRVRLDDGGALALLARAARIDGQAVQGVADLAS